MPSIYNYDNSSAPCQNAAYFSNKPIEGVSAFHPNAPKGLPGLTAPRVPNDTSKIPMPNLEDHNTGGHIAKVSSSSARATPFNIKIKGDTNTHFKMPTGKLGQPSDDINAEPRTEFAARVRLLIDYLKATPGAEQLLNQLQQLYVNFNDRLPSSSEIAIIEAAEAVMAAYPAAPAPAAPAPPAPAPAPAPAAPAAPAPAPAAPVLTPDAPDMMVDDNIRKRQREESKENERQRKKNPQNRNRIWRER